MIDFACKKIEIEEIIKCSLNLSTADFKLLTFFVRNSHEEFSTEKLSNRLKLDKSTIQRGVKKLHEKDLLFRSQTNKTSGGYLFFYKIKEKEKIKKKILDILKGWNRNVLSELYKW